MSKALISTLQNLKALSMVKRAACSVVLSEERARCYITKESWVELWDVLDQYIAAFSGG